MDIKIKSSRVVLATDSAVSKLKELKDAETEKANNKTSAQNKLKALGLTDAEIEAL